MSELKGALPRLSADSLHTGTDNSPYRVGRTIRRELESWQRHSTMRANPRITMQLPLHPPSVSSSAVVICRASYSKHWQRASESLNAWSWKRSGRVEPLRSEAVVASYRLVRMLRILQASNGRVKSKALGGVSNVLWPPCCMAAGCSPLRMCTRTLASLALEGAQV